MKIKLTIILFFAGMTLCSCFKEINIDGSGSPSSSSASADISTGLKALYTFDDSTSNDQSGHGRHASMVNNATIVDEDGNPCLKLGFSNADYLNIPYNMLANLDHWSVCFWVKGLTAGNVFAAQYNDNNSGYSDYPMLWADQNDFLKVKTHSGYIDNHGDQISYNYSNNSGAWHHYVLLRDGGNGQSPVKFYVDGVLVDNLNIYCDNSQGSKIVFGGNKNGAYSVAPSMRLDNIRFYGRALSTSDIRAIYDMEK